MARLITSRSSRALERGLRSAAVGIAGAGRERLGALGDLDGALLLPLDVAARAIAALHVEADVHDEPIQPGVEARAALEFAERAVHLEKASWTASRACSSLRSTRNASP